MHSSSPTPHKKVRIEIIPLIDIMFFLLASFMLVSLSLVKLQGAKVDLPPAGKPLTDEIKKPDFTTVSVDKTGNLVWTKNGAKDKENISLEELGKRARALYNQNKEAKVFVNADKDVPYREVLAVMDRLRRSGLIKLTFATKSFPTSAAASGAPAPSAPGP